MDITQIVLTQIVIAVPTIAAFYGMTNARLNTLEQKQKLQELNGERLARIEEKTDIILNFYNKQKSVL